MAEGVGFLETVKMSGSGRNGEEKGDDACIKFLYPVVTFYSFCVFTLCCI